jgi:hypothetical protein
MDSVIIAALVAGIISLAGVLANLYIARQTRRAALLHFQLQSLAPHVSKSSEQLKSFIAEAERVRICCWSLLGHIEYLQRQRNSSDTYEPLKNDTKAFEEAVAKLYQGTRTFEESWAPVKGEIPQGIERYIRSHRHNCLNMIRAADSTIRMLVLQLEKNDKGLKAREAINRSEEILHEVLTSLDRLISLVKSVNERNMNERLLKS